MMVAPDRPRVLFYDYWTKGIDKFARVVRIAPEDAAYSLLHLGSFRDASVPRRQVLREIPCVDISEFGRENLDAIIGKLDPDVIVGLNLATLFDRTIILTARRLGVPTVFLQHGSWADPDELRPLFASLDRGFTWADRVRRLPKFARLLPWYLHARGSTPFDASVWRMLARLVRAPTLSHFYPTATDELQPALALVFKEKDADTLADTHGMPRDRMVVVGNPDLDEVVRLKETLSPEERRACLRGLGLSGDQPVVCYLEDGFVEQQHCFGWTEERRIALLEELYQASRSAGAQLMIRPHPGSNKPAMTAAFAGRPGMVVTWQGGLIGAVSLSDVVMGTISTAMETAVILHRPILVPVWHVNGQVGTSPFLRYGVAHAVENAADLPAAIRSAVDGTIVPGDSDAFFRERMGPVDGNATTRVSARILELARSHWRTRAAGSDASVGDGMRTAV